MIRLTQLILRSMEPIRVGVIGVGHLGQHHARLYASLAGARLVGVMDIDAERAAVIGDRYGAPAFGRAQDLLDRVDAVSVAVPTSAHYGVVKMCLEAGVHVLVEKPIAVTPAEAYALIDLAQTRERTLQVGHVERFNPIMRAVRPHIGKPGFIECHRLNPFGQRGTDVDVVLDLMIHDLDLILSLDPGPVEEVRAAGVPVLSPNIDIANARIQFASGCVANLTSSRVSAMRMRKLRIFQREGYLSIDYQARQGTIARRIVNADGAASIEMELVQGGDEEPLKAQLEAFLSALQSGTDPAVSGEAGAAALQLAHQILHSIETFVRRHSEHVESVKSA